jgi:hypothetical protein
MTAIHSKVLHGGWRRVSHRPRHARRLIERALASVRDWLRHRRNRFQIAALDAQFSRDIESRRGDSVDFDCEQKELNAWLNTLGYPPV